MAHDPKEVANKLAKFYESPFSGKKRGKYRLRRRALWEISGRRALRAAFIEELREELLEQGYFLIDLRDTDAKSDFGLVSLRYVNNFRPLPKSQYRHGPEQGRERRSARRTNSERR